MCYDIPFVVGFCLSFCNLFMSCISYHVIMCISFAYVFVFCIRVFSPLSVLQSGTPTSSGAPLLFSFMSGCQTFSEWTEACQVTLVYHWWTTSQVSFHLEVVWYSNGLPGNRKVLLCVAAKKPLQTAKNPSKSLPCSRSFDHDRVGKNRTSFGLS